MVLLIDNYDSFTFNIYEYLKILHQEVIVINNDDIRLFDLDFDNISHIIISPGPKRPEDAGFSLDIIKLYEGKIPILGICLGFQCINYVHNGTLLKGNPVHGVVDKIYHNKDGLYEDLKNPLKVTRYHSLSIDKSNLDKMFTITSKLKDSTIMSIENKDMMLYGVQYHPEAILTEQGLDLFKNFLRIKNEKTN
ncbi:MAG: aminodeoxychorismate/anthranilate synthase component II [Firmicutes bacterium]|nr:aminodeoxychorismate/anthranilate synthase component II [Bacillota bacterium]